MAVAAVAYAHGSGYKVFTSQEHGFSMQYPDTWEIGGTVNPNTVIRVVSPEGDDYNIVVWEDEEFLSMSELEFAEHIIDHSEYFIAQAVSLNYPNPKLISSGITNLSQQPAAYIYFDFKISAVGREIPIRCLTIVTKRENKSYTLTFRTPVPFFEEYKTVIEALALAFQLNKVQHLY